MFRRPSTGRQTRHRSRRVFSIWTLFTFRSTSSSSDSTTTLPSQMEKIRYGKWATSIAVGVLLTLLAPIIAQPGFLNIDCGGKTKGDNLTWVTDVNYIDVGRTVDAGNASLPSYLQSLRLFPKPLNKSCYKLRVTPNVRYLLRVWWALSNSSDFKTSPTSFTFSIETMGMLASRNITIQSDSVPTTGTRILVTSGRALYICFIRTSEMSDPFVNAIQLRTLGKGMYEQAKPGTMLRAVLINSVGGNSAVSYPQDKFDRLWTVGSTTMAYTDNQNRHKIISTGHRISTNNTTEHPPAAVLQAAWKQILINNSASFLFDSLGPTQGTKALLMLYFAEIEPVNMSEPRSFYLTVNGESSETITLVQMYSAVQLTFLINATSNLEFKLVQAGNSTLTPLLNALEQYQVIDTVPATYSEDIKSLSVIKRRFNIKDWVSDPCFFIPWEGISCDNSSSIVRISEINLSGRNLTGSLPEHIGQFTALVDVSLDNNNFTGSLPDYSNLTMLERLNLQNNKLSGNVPEWLSQLKNLKELLIQNNNFSGVIPMQLLLDRSLTINYSGNPYLCMHKGECTLPKSKRNILKFVVPITLTGILIIALALAVGIVMYRKKYRKKDVATGIDSVEKQPEEPVDRDYSMIMVPKETKSHAFTLNEMMTATDNFTIKIGQGGFGSVYFGKLPEGKDIAIKVLSQFSKQGVNEFLNEVDLLSRVNHRNLVSLIGYCNDSKELMLIYDHMSGGSLRDHLYGCSAEHYGLEWKTRLKIASDAAQGLEYLHMACTPKIIHRDVKSANILLDSHMNGKLGDFGISRMTIDHEATHVTTTVKGTTGYLDPEYFNTQMLTEKSDVYSFGVVLLEIICGRQPIDTKLSGEEINIIAWVTPHVDVDLTENPSNIAAIIDKKLGENYDVKSIIRVARLAIKCVDTEPSCRPSSSEVLAELKEAIKEMGDMECGNMHGHRVSFLDSSGDAGMESGVNSSMLLGR